MQEPVRLKSACISCMVKSALENFPEDTAEEQKREYMQRVLGTIAGMEKHHSGPIISRAVQDIQKEMFGNLKDYTEIKTYFNQLMMTKVSELEKNIMQTKDPLKLAMKYSMTGNYIDFGTSEKVDEATLERYFAEGNCANVSEEMFAQLEEQLKNATKIVLLLDNCGEIVVDKLLISTICRLHPQIKVTAVVRGGVVLNDVTMEDANQVKLHEVANVISNGDNVAGTCLDRISKEAKKAIDDADLILSKGQGNFETLCGCGKNIFYIFLCKCEMFAKQFKVPKFTGMLIHEKNL